MLLWFIVFSPITGAYGGQSLKLPQEDASELARVALTPSDEILPSFHVVADTLNRFPQRKLVLDHEDILACVGRHLEERIQTLKRHLAPVKYHQLAMLQSSQVSTTSAIANNDDITTLDGLKRVAETRDEYTKSVMRKPSRMLDMSELILTRDDYSTMESITKPKEALYVIDIVLPMKIVPSATFGCFHYPSSLPWFL